MPEKLLTLKELSAYLNMHENEIQKLVDDGVIPAYVIGGSFLRFRKEQIDAIKDELMARSSQPAVEKEAVHGPVLEIKEEPAEIKESFADKIHDFFYFNDFYIVSAFIVAVLLVIIFKM